jgi:NADH:ubiquinone oxidoreductase subunit K
MNTPRTTPHDSRSLRSLRAAGTPLSSLASLAAIRGGPKTMIRLLFPLIFSAALFSIGVYGVLARRNGVLVLMSIELMLNAVNVNLVAFSQYLKDGVFAGQIFTLFVITVAAAEVGIGLAIVILIYRNRETINVDEVNLLKW